MSDVQAFGWLADHTGCGTIRIKQPMDALKSEFGIETAYSEKIITTDLQDLPPAFVGQRVCKDGPSQLWFTICALKNRPRTVYELDDDLWNIDPSNAQAFNWFINGINHLDGKKHDVSNNIRRNVAAADYVTCTTEPLAEHLRVFNPNVHIIPNYLPRWVLEWERPRREQLTIGWGGSGTHNMDWEAHIDPIKQYLRRSKTPFSFIGARKQDIGHIGLPLDQVSTQEWFPSVEDYWKAIDYDIGIIPLRHHVFNQSKSNLKYLENSALGIPTVAADSGPYSSSIKHGETGFLVKRDHEWAKYLRMLVEDEDMRTEIGNNAKAWAKTMVLEDRVDEWKKVLLG